MEPGFESIKEGGDGVGKWTKRRAERQVTGDQHRTEKVRLSGTSVRGIQFVHIRGLERMRTIVGWNGIRDRDHAASQVALSGRLERIEKHTESQNDHKEHGS